MSDASVSSLNSGTSSQQSPDFGIDPLVVWVAFHVFPAGMDVAQDTLPVDEKAHTGKWRFGIVLKPPAFDCPPLGINSHREFKPYLFSGALDFFWVHRTIGFVVVGSKNLQATPGVLAVKLIQGRGRVHAIGAVWCSPPPDEDNFAAQVRKFQRFGVDPILQLPFGNRLAEVGALDSVCHQSHKERQTTRPEHMLVKAGKTRNASSGTGNA